MNIWEKIGWTATFVVYALVVYFWLVPDVLDRRGAAAIVSLGFQLTLIHLASSAVGYALIKAYPYDGVKRFFSPAPPPPKPARRSNSVESLDAYQLRERILERWPWY